MPNNTDPNSDGISRRRFLAASGMVLTAEGASLTASAVTAPPDAASDVKASRLVSMSLDVNGSVHRLDVEPRATLLDTLRERLDLCGTKKGCDHGQCGACTVHIDGRRVVSCLTLAVQAQGKKVTTIEGVSHKDGRLHPMQQAFLDHDGLQCGYCTPGQIMSAIACVREGHARSADEIREYMSGNLCRCGAYVGILAAIQDAAGREGSS
jgi:xanthine dehydrogenase YagT iron-sulfur-binding subunit